MKRFGESVDCCKRGLRVVVLYTKGLSWPSATTTFLIDPSNSKSRNRNQILDIKSYILQFPFNFKRITRRLRARFRQFHVII